MHENEALHTIRYMVKPKISPGRLAKQIIAKGIVGETGIQVIKTIKDNMG